MAYMDVYIGDLTDAQFKWAGGDWSGNVPTRCSPFFPCARDFAFFRLITAIEKKAYVGTQADWGAWVARMTRGQILAFIEECYAGVTRDGLDELLDYVRGLEAEREYAVVAAES